MSTKQMHGKLWSSSPESRVSVTSGSEVSNKVVTNHLQSFLKADLDGVISDYTNESVLITHIGVFSGVEEIKGFFSDLLKHFPFQQHSFELDKLIVDENLVFIVWHATTPTLQVPFGTDTFIVKDGKISQQTFGGVLNFKK